MASPTPRASLAPIYTAVESVVVGQRRIVDRLLIALLTDGHVLLEGVPGLAKTLLMRTLAGALTLRFSRAQFTPDLLPADVIGTQIYNPRTGDFTVKKGPVFANILLAEEINRAPAKVQSALLQAMAERQITIGDETFPLPRPFFVLATQNPIEQEGTYPLPEAQLDRFMLKVLIQHPTREEDLAILDRMSGVEATTEISPVLSVEALADARRAVDQVHVDPKVKGYLVDVVRATREAAVYGISTVAELISHGAGPRAVLSLARAIRAHAYLAGREYALPDDVKLMAADVLRHRLILSYEAEAEEISADQVIQRILDQLPVP